MKNFISLFKKSQSGQSLIELMITVGLAAVLLPALLSGFVAARSGRAQQEQRQVALGYVKEGMDAVRIFREADWTTFANDSSTTATYKPVAGSTWTLQAITPAGGTETLSTSMVRKITISDVWRDAITNVIESSSTPGAVNDPSTKKVTTTVSWTTPISSSVDSTEYLTRYGNAATIQTGSVYPPGGGNGNWCNPSAGIIGSPYTLGAIPITLIANPTSTKDFAYTSTGNNRSSGSPLFELNVDHATPPGVTSPYSSSDNAKAYGVYSDGTYAYFVENSNGHTVEIAKASDLTDVGYFDNGKYVGGTLNTGTVAVLGTGNTANATGYVAIGSNIYSFDLSKIPTKDKSNKIISQAASSSATLVGNALKMAIVGAKIYIVTDDSSKQLQIFPLLSSGAFGTRQDVSMGNSQSGVDLSIDSAAKYAYVVTNYSASAPGKKDVFVVDLSDTSKIYGYSTNMQTPTDPITGDMNPRGVAAVTDDKVIVAGCNADNGNDKCLVHSSGWIYQVFDFTSGPSSASRCGGMIPQLIDNSTTPPTATNLSSINAVAGVDQRAYTGNVFSYIVDGVNSSSQFQIIQGGSGISGGSGTGVVEGSFDPGHAVAYNYFSATPSTDPNVSYQIAIKAPTGTCATTTFSDSDFVSISANSPISLPGVGYTNPAECLHYRVKNQNTGTINYTVTINYSL